MPTTVILTPLSSKAFVDCENGMRGFLSFLAILGFPSVKTIKRFLASGLSPPSAVNNLVAATFIARSVRVPHSVGTGEIADDTVLFRNSLL